ncbi:hypothetical protein FRC00_005141, partial [Tulasnella sp. 408]
SASPVRWIETQDLLFTHFKFKRWIDYHSQSRGDDSGPSDPCTRLPPFQYPPQAWGE